MRREMKLYKSNVMLGKYRDRRPCRDGYRTEQNLVFTPPKSGKKFGEWMCKLGKKGYVFV